MRTLLIDIKLDISEIHHMQVDRTGIPGNQFRKIHNLLFCSLAGVWRRMEIYRIDHHATFCDHVTSHRAVDTARQQKHGFSVRSHWHTARSRNHHGINIH